MASYVLVSTSEITYLIIVPHDNYHLSNVDLNQRDLSTHMFNHIILYYFLFSIQNS